MKLARIDATGATEAFAAWRAALDGLSKLTGGGLAVVSKEPAGPVVRAPKGGGRWVKLAGSGNPYTVTPVYATASGGWTDLPGGADGMPGYEANAVTGLGGKVVRAEQTAAGDWRFAWRRQGASVVTSCNMATWPGTLTLSVIGRTYTMLPAGGGAFYSAGDATLLLGRDGNAASLGDCSQTFPVNLGFILQCSGTTPTLLCGAQYGNEQCLPATCTWYRNTHFPSSSSTSTATITSFTNSPFNLVATFPGAWTPALPVACSGLACPISGTATITP